MTTPTDPTTSTTSGITEINGPAVVITDGSTPADPLCVVFASDGFCLQWDFQTTTTSVAVDVPPLPGGLPNTGATTLTAPIAALGVLATVVGTLLCRKARRRL